VVTPTVQSGRDATGISTVVKPIMKRSFYLIFISDFGFELSWNFVGGCQNQSESVEI
jgi:hypothetical protein